MKNKPDWTTFKKSITSHGRVLPLIERIAMRENADNQSKRDTTYLHPSEICKDNWCPRSSFYRLTGEEEKEEVLAFSLLNVFAEGNMIHDKYQRWLGDAGVLIGMWVCTVCKAKHEGKRPTICGVGGCTVSDPRLFRYREVPIFNEDHHVIGHSDGLIEDSKGRALIEIKSVGVGTLRFEAPSISTALGKGEMTLEQAWSAIRYPFPTHIRQGQLYMYFTGVHTIIYVYECKWNQQVKEFTVHLDVSKIENILQGCLAVKSALSRGKQPPRPIWAQEDNAVCKKCPFYEKCWSNEDHQTSSGRSSGSELQEEVLVADEALGRGTGTTKAIRRTVRPRPDGVVL
jgi:hypothetical protein